MKAFVRKQDGEGGGIPSWRSDPITSAQLWKIQKDRDRLNLPTLTSRQIDKMTKGEASDMIRELVALLELGQEEAQVAIETYFPEGDYSGTAPWE